MKTISKVVSRSVLTLAVAGLGLVFTPRVASADFISFGVNEGVVPLANPLTFTADKLNGGYVETLSLTPTGPGGGTFTANAFATFSAYYLNGTKLVTPQIGGSSSFPQSYQIVTPLTASGTYQLFNGTTCLAAECFFGTSGTATVYLDPNNDTTAPGTGNGEDLLLLTATSLQPGSGGQVDAITSPTTGNFNLVFGNNVLSALGQLYWPTLQNLIFSSVVNGDFDSITSGNTQSVRGDVSAQFTAVPEPATLTLLGLGLSGLAAARRRKAQAVRNL